MIIKTEIPEEHLALIQVFIDANELVGVEIKTEDIQVREKVRKVLHLHSTNEDTSMKLTYMALLHCGAANMLDDFLLKCQVPVTEIRSETNTTYMNEERKEKLKEMEQQFNKGTKACTS